MTGSEEFQVIIFQENMTWAGDHCHILRTTNNGYQFVSLHFSIEELKKIEDAIHEYIQKSDGEWNA